MKMAHRRRAFTLIEMLTVIAIIAILAGMLFPVFAKARAKAMQADCTSNVKQMAMAIIMYQSDYDQRSPMAFAGAAAYAEVASTTPQAGQPYAWTFALSTYTKNNQIYNCRAWPTTQVFDGKVAPLANGTGISYGYNLALSAYKQTRVTEPANTVAVFDRSDEGGGGFPFLTLGGSFTAADVTTQTRANHGGDLKAGTTPDTGFCLVGWADGHAKAVKSTELAAPSVNIWDPAH